MKIGILLTVIFGLSMATAQSQTVQLFAPEDLGNNRTTLSFDEFPHASVGNSVYQGVGITFSRDDGGYIPIVDYSQVNRQTTSGSNILGTFSFPIIGATQAWSTHLVVDSLQPLTQVGAFFGNDSFISSFGFQRLSIFGFSNQLLGSIDVNVNNNAHVDQFIGLRSGEPFYRIRFENYTPSGDVSPGHAVAIDDFMFTTAVPEPSTWALLCIGSVFGWLMLRRRVRPVRRR